MNLARKLHSQKRSNEDIDVLYNIFPLRWLVLKNGEHTSCIRKTGKLDVTDPNGDITKFGTEEREG